MFNSNSAKMGWVGVLGMLSATTAWALNDGIDAYRLGHYDKASASLMHDAKPDPVSDYYLARMRLYGYGVLKNDELGLRYLKRAADRGYLPAVNAMARLALNRCHDFAAALLWFKKAADANDTAAQMYCAAAYREGLGSAKNDDASKRYLIAAAKNGNALAQYTLAEQFLSSSSDATKRVGLVWLNKAVEKQNVAAMLRLAQLHQEGRLVEQDAEKANVLVAFGIEAHDARAYVERAHQAQVNGDLSAAASAYTDAANAGSLPAAQALVAMYQDEKNALHNQSLATEWRLKAENMQKNTATAQQKMLAWLSDGHASTWDACGYGSKSILSAWRNPLALEQSNYNQAPQMPSTSRGVLYNPQFVMIDPNAISLVAYYHAYTKSTPVEPLVAIDFPRFPLLEKAVTPRLIEKAVLGDSTVQFALGQLYQQGVSVDKNVDEMLKYYKKAAAQQDLRAEYNLGLVYLSGEAGKPDYQQGIGWLNDAAFKGSTQAQYVLAQLAEIGLQNASGEWVVSVDKDKAMSMYYLAAANHDGAAQHRLATLLIHEPLQGLTAAQVTKRKELVRDLYAGAVANGVREAEIPHAFLSIEQANQEQKVLLFNRVQQEAANSNQQSALLLGLLYDRGLGVTQSHDKALQWYQRVANSNPVSAFILGTNYAKGQGVSADPQQAVALLQVASDAGFSYAPLNLAVLNKQMGQPFLANLEQAHHAGNVAASLLLADYYLLSGSDVAFMQQARAIYMDLAQAGDPNGQLKAGYMLAEGLGGPRDVEQAAHWYSEAALHDQPLAQYELGRLNQLGWLSHAPDYERAKQWYAQSMHQYKPAAVALGFVNETVDDHYDSAFNAYKSAALSGDTVAQFNLALMLEKGKGMAVDMNEAMRLYQAAAAKGHVQAMVQLAGLHLNGLVGGRDESQALLWYQKAAAKGDRGALYQLGLLSETGLGLSLNYSDAVKYYQAASARGHAKAMLALARLYQYGLGVAQNREEAMTLYKELALDGNAYAAYQLAMLSYADGEHSAQTKHWLELARDNGSPQAAQMLQWLAAKDDKRVSYIESLPSKRSTADNLALNEPPNWLYMGALSAWNQGNESRSRWILTQLLKTYPNYTPAREVYSRLESQSGSLLYQ